MRNTNGPIDGRPSITDLERRITELEEQNEELKAALDQQQDSGLPSVSRRQALGLLGGSALLGATGRVGAQSSSDDTPFANEDHDHGGDYLGESAPVNRLDVGEIYNANGSKAVQTAWDGMVVPVAPGLGAKDAIDPSTTSTPVQDAVNRVDEANSAGTDLVGGGAVLLPPEPITEGDTIQWKNAVSLYGWGIQSSIIDFTKTGKDADLVRINDAGRGSNNSVQGIVFGGGGVWLRGPGRDETTGVGIRIGSEQNGGNLSRSLIGQINISDVRNSLITTGDSPGEGAMTGVHIDLIRGGGFDAGDAPAAFDFRFGPGFGVSANRLVAYPLADQSEKNTTGVVIGGGSTTNISYLNFGGAMAETLVTKRPLGSVTVHEINRETPIQKGTPETAVRVQGQKPTRVNHLNLRVAPVQYAYTIEDDTDDDIRPGRHYFGQVNAEPFRPNGGYLQENYVNVKSDTGASCVYEGTSDEVTNSTGGSLSNPVACLGDLTTVQ